MTQVVRLFPDKRKGRDWSLDWGSSTLEGVSLRIGIDTSNHECCVNFKYRGGLNSDPGTDFTAVDGNFVFKVPDLSEFGSELGFSHDLHVGCNCYGFTIRVIVNKEWKVQAEIERTDLIGAME